MSQDRLSGGTACPRTKCPGEHSNNLSSDKWRCSLTSALTFGVMGCYFKPIATPSNTQYIMNDYCASATFAGSVGHATFEDLNVKSSPLV